ncbi:hypothetical protein QYF36_018515 [Acer negundo]|nr:hypothetical protein QYF36_018515 [Acer negundo]
MHWNQVIHNKATDDDRDDFVDERRSISQVETLSISSSAPVPKWRPPADGFWKINTDAATCYKEHLIGLESIFRDKNGLVKATVVNKITTMVSSLAAVAMAVMRGIQLAVFKGIGHFHIEYDSI